MDIFSREKGTNRAVVIEVEKKNAETMKQVLEYLSELDAKKKPHEPRALGIIISRPALSSDAGGASGQGGPAPLVHLSRSLRARAVRLRPFRISPPATSADLVSALVDR